MIGNNVKENIIIKSPANHYEYSFSLVLENLIAECDTYGNIRLLDNQTSECKYVLPAPFMFDAANTFSYDVSYELTVISNGNYVIKVSADSNWINDADRVFPVTIDPSINTNSNIVDTHVWGSYPDSYYGHYEDMFVCSNSIALIKFNLPNIPEGATLNVPNLYVYYYADASTSNTKIGAYKILSSWNENTVTWNSKPTIDNTIQSNATLYHSTDNTSSTNKVSVRFTVRNAVEDWLEDPSTNYGIAIKYISGVDTYIHLNTVESGTQYPRISISYNFQFDDGIYSIKNMSSSTSYLNAPTTSYYSGGSMRRATYSSESNELSVANRERLFKISYDAGNRYIIRLMTNNNLTFGISGTNVITKEIPPLDDDVASADTFYIEWDGYGYLLRPYGSDNVIKINSTSSSSLSVVEKGSATATGRWNLVKHTYLQPQSGLSVSGIYANMTVGRDYVISPYYWATLIDVEPSISISSEYSDIATGTWNSDTQRFSVNLHEPGTFSINIQLLIDGITIQEWEFDVQSQLLVENGSYFVKNVKLEKYLRIHSNNGITYEDPGEKIKVGNYSGHPIQIWNFIHLGDGYYRIESYFSELSLSVQSEYVNTNNKSLVQESCSNNDTQKWKISQSTSGNLVFRPKSAELYTTDWCMSAGAYSLSDRDVEQREYTNDSDYKDEWRLFGYRKTMLLAYDDTVEDRALLYDDIRDLLVGDTENNFMAVEILEFGFTTELIEFFENSEIIVLHTHGEQTGIYRGSDAAHPDENFDNYIRIQAFQNVDLSDLRFVVLLTCNGAVDFDEAHITNNTPHNIVEQLVISGAETVVGFDDETSVYASNIFAAALFNDMVVYGSSVKEAVDLLGTPIDEGYDEERLMYGVSDTWIQDVVELLIIAGNENYTIN